MENKHDDNETTISSPLCVYLQEHFPVGGDWTNQSFAADFFKNLQVNIKNEDNLYTFKYDQTLCESWHIPAVSECRGIIMRKSNIWQVASRPFAKFFNQNEGQSPVGSVDVFNKLSSEFEFVEKADGTCIQLWYDDHLVPTDDQTNLGKPGFYDYRKWRVSTLGLITPHQWVPDLFWNLLKPQVLAHLQSEQPSLFYPGCTYLFELCCEKNRIVTEYERDTLFIIGARDIRSGDHFSKEMLDALADQFNSTAQKISLSDNQFNMHPILLPKRFSFRELGIQSLSDAKEYIERQSKSENNNMIYGKDPEGFVIYYNNAPLCKMKNKSYVEKHGVVTGNLLYVRNIVIDRYFNETLDDVIDAVRQEPILQFIEELKGKVKQMIVQIEEVRVQLCRYMNESPEFEKALTERRVYSELVNSKVDPQWRGFFLSQQASAVHDDCLTSGPVFMSWLKKNYTKFKNHWKDTQAKAFLNGEIHTFSPADDDS